MWICSHELAALRAGGAWTIGYKAWGSLLGRRLSKHGCLCYCVDYRNFPRHVIPAAQSIPRLTNACCPGMVQTPLSRLCCISWGVGCACNFLLQLDSYTLQYLPERQICICSTGSTGGLVLGC